MLLALDDVTKLSLFVFKRLLKAVNLRLVCAVKGLDLDLAGSLGHFFLGVVQLL